jgi:curved DNA-binding protein CbpA
MSTDPPDDAVFSLEEVFRDEEIFRLVLSEEEWEVIIALAEVGGQSSMEEIKKITRMENEVMLEILRSLIERRIIARGEGEEPSDAARSAPDAEVSQYLEYLADMNHYQVLQLSPEADQSQVRRSYFRLMREYSPDRFMKERNPETREQLKEIFRILTRAYETLSDSATRREYDLSIPDFTGAQEREDDLVLEALWSGEVGPGPLPDSNPELAKSFYENALDDFRKNDHMSAELNFKLAVALDPGNDDYKAGLAKSRRILHTERAGQAAVKGLGHEEEGRFRRAIRWMSQAVELDPEVADYRYDLARLIEAHGQDLNSARMHILMALDRHPGKVDYLLLFGMIQQRLGEITDARRTFKKVLSLDPENKAAKEKLDNLA